MTSTAAVTSSQALWFASRGTGVVCLLLLTASFVLGIVTTMRVETRGWPRFILAAMHRNVSLLILIFLAVHIVTTVVDAFAPIHYLDAIIPFQSPYRTVWLGLGTVACDLLIALTITSLIRVRLGYSVWRAVHWLAYACWPIALVHGLGTGSDAQASWMTWLVVASLAMVLVAAGWRITATPASQNRVRWGAAAALVIVPVVMLWWARTGPLQPGWSHSFRKSPTTSTVPQATGTR